MKFDVNNLPEGFPPDGMIQSHGKPYITHVGLVWLANHRGKPWSGAIVEHDIRLDSNQNPVFCKVVYKVWDDEQEHSDIGDASMKSTTRMIAPHLIRMASTRAQNRALRAFVGYAGCTADELGQYDTDSDGCVVDSYKEPKPQNRAQVRRDEPVQQAKGSGDRTRTVRQAQPGRPSCPCCGAVVYDNRETATGKQPLFVCSAKELCAGAKKRGDKTYGWSSWDADWWDKELAKAKADEEDSSFVEESQTTTRMFDDASGVDLASIADSLAMEDSDVPF